MVTSVSIHDEKQPRGACLYHSRTFPLSAVLLALSILRPDEPMDVQSTAVRSGEPRAEYLMSPSDPHRFPIRGADSFRVPARGYRFVQFWRLPGRHGGLPAPGDNRVACLTRGSNQLPYI